MKIIIRAMIGFAFFLCLAFPVFSQDQSPNLEIFNSLSESMDSSITRSTTMLSDYDKWLTNDGDYKMFSSYKKRYEELVTALRESEAKMSLLYRTKDRTEIVRRERDNYNGLLTELQSVKDDYAGWLRTVQ